MLSKIAAIYGRFVFTLIAPVIDAYRARYHMEVEWRPESFTAPPEGRD